MNLKVSQYLREAFLIFWDFDGVIKDSVDVKTAAFERLFLPYGEEIVSRVRHHHENHCGVSRFDKIPVYLTWAGEQANPAQVEVYCERFSKSVIQAVIDSPWVPGVREYIREHFLRQYFVLLTATPQDEIEKILAALDLSTCFREVHGAPTKKSDAIRAVMSRRGSAPAKALMIGDAETDLRAAQANSIPFLLRRTSLNQPLQASYSGPMFDHLNYE
jgi:phosphoglycolate phosphatase-like HAD superfamily hydrolase